MIVPGKEFDVAGPGGSDFRGMPLRKGGRSYISTANVR